MPELKREIRTLGQRLSGLSAGNTYTFVLKKPKPSVDVENAQRAAARALAQLEAVQEAALTLESAREAAERGAGAEAREHFARARRLVSGMNRGIAEAREYARCAEDDAKDAPAEVRDEYEVARDSAQLAVDNADKAVEAAEAAVRAVGAIIEAATAQEA